MTLLPQVAQMGRIDAIDRHMLDSQWVAALAVMRARQANGD
jgi:hypothetical protein